MRAEARQGALWVYLETTDPGDVIRPDCAASGHGSRALGWNEWEAGIPQGIEVEPHKGMGSGDGSWGYDSLVLLPPAQNLT